jgi:pterin-4a-carbinolamine dehydratase
MMTDTEDKLESWFASQQPRWAVLTRLDRWQIKRDTEQYLKRNTVFLPCGCRLRFVALEPKENNGIEVLPHTANHHPELCRNRLLIKTIARHRQKQAKAFAKALGRKV